MSMTKRKKVAIALLLLILTLGFMWLVWGEQITTRVIMLRTQFDIPKAELVWRETWEKIEDISNDPLLKGGQAKISVMDETFPDCIRTGGVLIYGSNEDFDTIMRTVFDPQLTALGLRYLKPVFTAPEGLVLGNNYSNEQTLVSIEDRTNWQFNLPEWKNYRTIYEVDIQFSVPSLSRCHS